MSKPFLSIITINLNNAEGLKRTISSVLIQEWKNIEFLIIDGGSIDSSVKIIKKNNEKISYWVSEKDSGVFNAMNKGIDKSTGKYLIFLNSGDELNGKLALENFINHKHFKGDIVYGDYKFEKGEKIYPDKLTPLFFIKSSLPHQSTFFKSSVFNIMGNYNESYRIGADRDFFIRCFLSEKLEFTHINYHLTLFDLSGLSNDENYIDLKRKEDKLILRSNYGVFYDDYMIYLKLLNEMANVKKNSFKGIVKRLKKRLSI